MREKIQEINNYISDGMPIIILVTWLCLVAVVIKILVSPIGR